MFSYATTALCGQIYKWVDKDGVTHFTDSLTDSSVIENYDVEYRYVKDNDEVAPPDEKEEDETNRNQESIDQQRESLPNQEIPPSPKATNSAEVKQSTRINSGHVQEERTVIINSGRIIRRTSRARSVVFRKAVPNLVKSKRTYPKVRNPNILEMQRQNALKKQRDVQRLQKEHRAKVEAYNKKLKEYKAAYEREKRKVDRYNAMVDEYNAGISESKKKAQPRGGYSMRKPYLGDQDPNRSYHERHPAQRGWGN